MKQHRGRFDRIELTLIAAFVAVTGFGAGVQYRDSAPLEGAYLEELYGPHRYSRNREEWIIRDFFRDERNGAQPALHAAASAVVRLMRRVTIAARARGC